MPQYCILYTATLLFLLSPTHLWALRDIFAYDDALTHAPYNLLASGRVEGCKPFSVVQMPDGSLLTRKNSST